MLTIQYMRRSSFLLAMILAAASLTPLQIARAQGANHEGGHEGDGIRCASGKPEMAIPSCTAIIDDKRESDENRAIALRNRAFRYQQLGDLNKAIADYTTALEGRTEPHTEAKTHQNRGLMYARNGDDSNALADFSRAIQIDPKLASAYINRASVYSRQGSDAQAIADLEQALAQNPGDGEIYKVRGSIYAHRGESQHAIEDFSRAIEFDPKDAEAWRGRGSPIGRWATTTRRH